ncbi:hypothetical protein D3C77_278070 [compost metagenome]
MPGICGLQRCVDNLLVTDQPGSMRQTAHADHFFDLERKPETGDLRQHRQTLGSLLPRPVRQVPAIQGHTPLIGIQFTAQCAEQAAFTGTVGTKNTQHLVGLHRQADIAQHLIGAPLQKQVFDTEHQVRPRSNR